MKNKFLFFSLLSLILMGCERNNENNVVTNDDAEHWSWYSTIERSITSAFEFGPFDLDNFAEARQMSSGVLEGDSLYVSRVSENQFLLTTDKSTRSILNLTVDMLDKYQYSSEGRDYYSAILNAEGSYKISEDSLFTYELKDIRYDIIHGHPYYEYETQEWTDGMYKNSGEIILNLIVNNTSTTYHYDVDRGSHIYCRETGRLVLSYDD